MAKLRTNITFTAEKPNKIIFHRDNQAVGGAELVYQADKPNSEQEGKIHVYGFSSYSGPWGCGDFRGQDATFYFSKEAQGIIYDQKVNNQHFALTLTIRQDQTPLYQAEIQLFEKTGLIDLNPVDSEKITEVGITRDGTKIARIYSELQSESNPRMKLPFPYNSRLSESTIQVCGFEQGGIEHYSRARDYQVKVKLDSIVGKNFVNAGFESVASSKKEIIQQLTTSLTGLEPTVKTWIPEYDPTRKFGKLVDLISMLGLEDRIE